jgi:tRNA(fMet)-specific endonuclease VapC
VGILIDSSLLIEDERGTIRLEEWLRLYPDELISMSIISLVELYHGLHRADSPERFVRRRGSIEEFRSQFPTAHLYEAAAERAGKLRADLQRVGETVGWHDLLLGATALVREDAVATANLRDFKKIPGLRVLHWHGKLVQ